MAAPNEIKKDALNLRPALKIILSFKFCSFMEVFETNFLEPMTPESVK